MIPANKTPVRLRHAVLFPRMPRLELDDVSVALQSFRPFQQSISHFGEPLGKRAVRAAPGHLVASSRKSLEEFDIKSRHVRLRRNFGLQAQTVSQRRCEALEQNESIYVEL
jgi:hypothetical protein